MQEWGSVCRGVGEFSHLKIEKFVGLSASWRLSFLVPKLQGFKVSKICTMFRWRILIQYYQISISCFLEDIDLIFKIFKKLLDESSEFVGLRLFQTCQKQHDVQIVRFPNIIFFENDSGPFLNHLKYPDVSKDK